jgi:hypothetical protein
LLRFLAWQVCDESNWKLQVNVSLPQRDQGKQCRELLAQESVTKKNHAAKIFAQANFVN